MAGKVVSASFVLQIKIAACGQESVLKTVTSQIRKTLPPPSTKNSQIVPQKRTNQMKLNPLNPRKALNKAFLKVKPNRTDIEAFKANLIRLLDPGAGAEL
ncbi:MAG: hypothetical protein KJ754_04155 [Bacteroidetes bacterium]|nr:hypothetical protein [Bacteroidota bacterium]MBU1578597.1 hypothetical protein [Bacteroidota bacterium]